MTVDFRELPMGGVSDEQLMDLMIQGMKGTELEDFRKKKMKRADREGLELFLKEASGRASTMEMFVKNEILYAIFFEGKRQDLKQPYIKRFFDSYKSIKPTPLAEKTSDDWLVYRNNRGAFSVTMPSLPEYDTLEEEDEDSIEPFVKHIFTSTDPQKMIGYFVAYNDYPVQYYLSRRKNAFTLLFKEYETGSSKIKILSEPEPVFTDGVEGRKCYVTNNGNYGELRLYIRGNRIYRMMKQNLATDKQELPDDIFFDSLKFVEHLPPEFEDFISEGGKITLKRFDRFYTEIDTLTDHESFVYNDFSLYTTNPHTGGSYIFGSAKIKDNYRIEHLDTFYNWRIDKYKSYRDSIISMVPVEIEGKAGREVFQAHKRTGNLMRYRFWIDNDELFFMSAHSDEKELFSETTDAFFNSFRRTGNNPPFDIYASKTKNILDGLKSEDTLVYQQNVGAMEYYQFIEEDLPLLYEAMYRNYPDDTLYYNGAKSKIIDNITYLNDASSIGELKKLYLQVNDIQKNKILRSLMDFSDEDKGRDAVIQLLLKKPPERLRSDALIFSCFEDSLALGAQYLPQLLNLLEKKDYRNDIIRLAVKLVRSDTMPYVNLVENSFEMLTKYALNDLEESKIIYASTDFVLMTHVKGKKITDEYTNIFLNAKMTRADHLKVEAVSVRLLNGLKTDEKLIEPLMTSLKTRYGMIKAYQKVGQLHKVPKNYRTPEAIAQVKLRVNIPLSRKLDDTKILGTIPWGSSKLYVIKFTCKYDDEMKDYVGLVGPFSASGEWEFDTLKAYPSWDEEAIKNWRKAAKDMLEDFEEKGK